MSVSGAPRPVGPGWSELGQEQAERHWPGSQLRLKLYLNLEAVE